MDLNSVLSRSECSKKSKKRLGRGTGSGLGKTAGRGIKGQRSRSGGGVRPGFEGGQMPIHRRLPKRGFKNRFRNSFDIINIRDINKFDDNSIVDYDVLLKKKIIKNNNNAIKLLGHGEIKLALTVKVNKISKSAKAKIEAAGGKVEVL